MTHLLVAIEQKKRARLARNQAEARAAEATNCCQASCKPAPRKLIDCEKLTKCRNEKRPVDANSKRFDYSLLGSDSSTAPFPVANFRHILAVLVDVLTMLD